MLIDNTLEEYIYKAASGSPTPGGGSVCALVGTLGAALSSMVGELTVGKVQGEEKIKVQGSIRVAKGLIDSLKDGVDKDAEVFEKVVAAYKMPKDTEEQKQLRHEAIQSVLEDAAELPYEMALLCLDAMNVSMDMINIGNKNVLSDAVVSGLLSYAALNGSLCNVKVNLGMIKDEVYAESLRSKIDELFVESEQLLSKIKSASRGLL